jgi:HEAT repeat protein
MKRPQAITILLLLLIASCALLTALRLRAKPERTINGIAISRWIEIRLDVAPRASGVAPGEVLPYIIDALQKRDSRFRRLAIALWPKLPTSIRNCLLKYKPVDARTLRFNALGALQNLGPAAEKAVPDLIEMTRDSSDAEVRCRALLVLGNIGCNSRAALSVELAALQDSDPVIRDTAALALYEFGPAAEAVVPPLIQAIKNPLSKPFSQILALASFGPKAQAAVPVLVEALNDTQLRGNALVALGKIGPAAAPAVPTLIGLLHGPREGHPSNEFLGPDQLVHDSAGRVDWNWHRPVYPDILEVLMNVGPAAQAALPTVEALLEDTDANIRVIAAMTVARLHGKPEDAVPTLVRELNNPTDEEESASWLLRFSASRSIGFVALRRRETAAWLLAEIGPSAKDAVPALLEAARGPDLWLAALAARAIWRITHDSGACLPLLERILSENDETADVFAAQLLEEMGAEAKPAVPALLRTLRATTWKCYYEVFRALEKIDPAASKKVFEN